MANRNTAGFGLIAQGTVGSTMASQGQGKYYIDAGYAQDLFQGCSVKSKPVTAEYLNVQCLKTENSASSGK